VEAAKQLVVGRALRSGVIKHLEQLGVLGRSFVSRWNHVGTAASKILSGDLGPVTVNKGGKP
jgi:hypothetical protein